MSIKCLQTTTLSVASHWNRYLNQSGIFNLFFTVVAYVNRLFISTIFTFSFIVCITTSYIYIYVWLIKWNQLNNSSHTVLANLHLGCSFSFSSNCYWSICKGHTVVFRVSTRAALINTKNSWHFPITLIYGILFL